ncbi:hypothetical protein ACHHYP_02943 [Achlya hypogyna]|uniref:PX domain-containing protein n=1 Tax=Achlya hypogyna TaxID=1202772 RepID=A0A1V9Z4Z5_ACHHY|nr:hypothetical protein ACHHYP_02943 [Achlya hypogyna]
MASFVGHRTTALVEKPTSPPAKNGLVKVPKAMAFVHLVVCSVRPALAPDGSFMEYDVEMANTRNGLVWNVRKRFSRFLELHAKLDALLDASHCQHCASVHSAVVNLELPPKKWHLFGTNVVDAGLAAMRARLFGAYITALLAVGAEKVPHACPLIAAGYLPLVLGFLTSPSVFMELNKIKLTSRSKVVFVPPPPKAPAPKRRGSGKKFSPLEPILEQDISSSSSISTVVILDAPSC